jgi:hypothetical protein
MGYKHRLNLRDIECSLRKVQAEFHKLNAILKSRRDPLEDQIIDNMMAGYAYVDQLLEEKADIFKEKNVDKLLEINHIVLCGSMETVRKEHTKHLRATSERFYRQAGCNIYDVLKWVKKNRKESEWRVSAGVYINILSQPQLFIEGNHRSGALIMSYLLSRKGKDPFVLSLENALSYFDPSTVVKESSRSLYTQLIKLPRIEKKFAKFLKNQSEKKYLV